MALEYIKFSDSKHQSKLCDYKRRRGCGTFTWDAAGTAPALSAAAASTFDLTVLGNMVTMRVSGWSMNVSGFNPDPAGYIRVPFSCAWKGIAPSCTQNLGITDLSLNDPNAGPLAVGTIVTPTGLYFRWLSGTPAPSGPLPALTLTMTPSTWSYSICPSCCGKSRRNEQCCCISRLKFCRDTCPKQSWLSVFTIEKLCGTWTFSLSSDESKAERYPATIQLMRAGNGLVHALLSGFESKIAAGATFEQLTAWSLSFTPSSKWRRFAPEVEQVVGAFDLLLSPAPLDSLVVFLVVGPCGIKLRLLQTGGTTASALTATWTPSAVTWHVEKSSSCKPCKPKGCELKVRGLRFGCKDSAVLKSSIVYAGCTIASWANSQANLPPLIACKVSVSVFEIGEIVNAVVGSFRFTVGQGLGSGGFTPQGDIRIPLCCSKWKDILARCAQKMTLFAWSSNLVLPFPLVSSVFADSGGLVIRFLDSIHPPFPIAPGTVLDAPTFTVTWSRTHGNGESMSQVAWSTGPYAVGWYNF